VGVNGDMISLSKKKKKGLREEKNMTTAIYILTNPSIHPHDV
jgi:hypothetical protein